MSTVQPGDRVKHLCSDPTCFLRGIVIRIQILPEPTVWVKWDPTFTAVPASGNITELTAPLPIKPEKVAKIDA